MKNNFLTYFIILFLSVFSVNAQTTVLTGTEDGIRRVTTNALVVINGSYTISSSAFVVINGDLTINKNATVTVNGKLIVEGDLYLETDYFFGKYNESEIIVTQDGIVSVQKELKGSGGTMTITSQNKNKYGTIAIYGGIGSNGNFSVAKEGNKSENISYSDAFYIDGATLRSGWSSESLSNTSSDAYTNSVTVLERAEEMGLLPIELVSFLFEDNEFIWQTASETNNDYFVVEYSKNGKEWFECTEHISSASDYGYTYTTVPTINTSSSVFSYFRLKQVDLNGDYSYSDVIVSENKVCDPCSEKYESNKLKVKELGNKWFRYINGELIYCEGDN